MLAAISAPFTHRFVITCPPVTPDGTPTSSDPIKSRELYIAVRVSAAVNTDLWYLEKIIIDGIPHHFQKNFILEYSGARSVEFAVRVGIIAIVLVVRLDRRVTNAKIYSNDILTYKYDVRI